MVFVSKQRRNVRKFKEKTNKKYIYGKINRNSMSLTQPHSKRMKLCCMKCSLNSTLSTGHPKSSTKRTCTAFQYYFYTNKSSFCSFNVTLNHFIQLELCVFEGKKNYFYTRHATQLEGRLTSTRWANLTRLYSLKNNIFHISRSGERCSISVACSVLFQLRNFLLP
jgi:hypothetical protein